jgi:hypothetical protein
METLGLFAAAGVRVVPIEDFAPGAMWVPEAEILLIDTRLTSEERAHVARAYLPVVLASERHDQC